MKIKSYCRITNEKVLLNGKKLKIERSTETNNTWLSDIYHSLKIQYLKFFKMDNLSKAGFLGAEMICRDIELDNTNNHNDIAIVCFNRSSSLDDDIIYQQTIQDKNNYYPSPAVFVYTLANIVTGEIAIRNKITGETAFYITEKFSPEQIKESITDILTNQNVNGLICGWVEYFQGHCDVLMMYIERENNSKIEITKEKLLNLY
ncbi:hypothetical protein LJC11_02180 [Bacteroidales bacterium OttesenSCG-928-I21]|nr:hypothetical protein [Bacteroidales bacterium OttesenSCG-928-I21]